MIVHKREQMHAAAETPILRSEQTQQRMHDLEEIVTVHGREKAFVALIICHGMEHAVIDILIIIAMYHFSHQEEILRDPVAVLSQPVQKTPIQTISHIETEAVNVKLTLPKIHCFKDMLHHSFVLKV